MKNQQKSIEDNLTKTGKILETLRADQDRRDALDHLPPQVILRARQLSGKGKFQRQAVKRTPKNFHWDTLTFDCGHTTEVLCSNRDVQREECRACLEDWLLSHSKPEKKKK